MQQCRSCTTAMRGTLSRALFSFSSSWFLRRQTRETEDLRGHCSFVTQNVWQRTRNPAIREEDLIARLIARVLDALFRSVCRLASAEQKIVIAIAQQKTIAREISPIFTRTDFYNLFSDHQFLSSRIADIHRYPPSRLVQIAIDCVIEKPFVFYQCLWKDLYNLFPEPMCSPLAIRFPRFADCDQLRNGEASEIHHPLVWLIFINDLGHARLFFLL